MDGVDRKFRANGAAGETADRRRRDSLFLTAPLRLDDDPDAREVRIRNLSEGGVMAEIDRDVRIGTGALLELRGIGRVRGKVAWCTQGRIGIALDSPIDPKRARKPVGGGTKTPFFAKAVPR